MGKLVAILKLLWPAIVKILGWFIKPVSNRVKIRKLRQEADEASKEMLAAQIRGNHTDYQHWRRVRRIKNRQIAELRRE